VRLIGEDGEQLGVMPTFKALELAQSKNLDLVEVAPNVVPPVCRLLDYGRFKYEQTKKEREARKNQKIVELKEIRLRPKIGEHDVDAKANRAIKFLEDGDKVKVTVLFRGRELAHPQLGRELLEEMANRLANVAVVERNPSVEGKTMFMILARGKQPAPPAPPPPRSTDEGAARPAPAVEPQPAVPAAGPAGGE
jgi:translation initiation factor IF-3